jgi:hypothetical protein
MAEVSILRKRRGVSRASITCLEKMVKEAEDDVSSPGIADVARRLKKKLTTLDTEFK